MKYFGQSCAFLLVVGCAPGVSSGPTDSTGAGDVGPVGDDLPGGDTSLGDSTAGDSETSSKTLSETYPRDVGMAADERVLFFDDFEQGWGRWDFPNRDTEHLFIENEPGSADNDVLRSTVTRQQLLLDQTPPSPEPPGDGNISASTRATFDRRVDTLYWRFRVRFAGIAPNPHHWARVSAGTNDFGSSGRANLVPSGDEGFWFNFDATNDNDFEFYAYWYNMRSGNCNNGTTTPGCAGDQGHSNYYGNSFRPKPPTTFPRDQWFCVEMMGKANSVGAADGELAFWIDDQLVEHYRPGAPSGTWLRETFHSGGCSFSACTPPAPFEGFDFRSTADVRFKRIYLDAYNQLDTFDRKIGALESKGLTVSREQTIYYDDVVAATERIGCPQP